MLSQESTLVKNNGIWLGFAITSAILTLVFASIFAHDYVYLKDNFDSSEGTILFDTKDEALGLAIGLGVLTLLLLGFAGYLYYLRKNRYSYM
jgi:hypothetical protein